MGAFAAVVDKSAIKAYLDQQISNENTKVVGSGIVNGAYYAACQVRYGLTPVTYAVVMTTSDPASHKGWGLCDEFECPNNFDCPESILELLSDIRTMQEAGLSNPALVANAIQWREKCRLSTERAMLSQLTANAILTGKLQIREGR